MFGQDHLPIFKISRNPWKHMWSRWFVLRYTECGHPEHAREVGMHSDSRWLLNWKGTGWESVDVLHPSTFIFFGTCSSAGQVWIRFQLQKKTMTHVAGNVLMGFPLHKKGEAAKTKHRSNPSPLMFRLHCRSIQPLTLEEPPLHPLESPKLLKSAGPFLQAATGWRSNVSLACFCAERSFNTADLVADGNEDWCQEKLHVIN